MDKKNSSKTYHQVNSEDKSSPKKYSDTIACKRFNELKEKYDLTQEQIGEALHYSRNAIQKYLSGASKLDIPRICAIAKAFNVSTDWLLGLTDNEREHHKYVSYFDLLEVIYSLQQHKSIVINPYIRPLQDGKTVSEYGVVVIQTTDRFLGELIYKFTHETNPFAQKDFLKNHKDELSRTPLLNWQNPEMDNIFIDTLDETGFHNNPIETAQLIRELNKLSPEESTDF